MLAGEPGPPPWQVRAAGILSALGALASAGVTAVWVDALLRGRSVLAIAMVLLGAALTVVFAASVLAIRRRGWSRPPVAAGLGLGTLSLLALASVPVELIPAEGVGGYEPDLVYQLSAGTPIGRLNSGATELSWARAVPVAGVLAAVTAIGYASVGLLRSRSASSWLAIRRQQLRRASGHPTTPLDG